MLFVLFPRLPRLLLCLRHLRRIDRRRRCLESGFRRLCGVCHVVLGVVRCASAGKKAPAGGRLAREGMRGERERETCERTPCCHFVSIFALEKGADLRGRQSAGQCSAEMPPPAASRGARKSLRPSSLPCRREPSEIRILARRRTIATRQGSLQASRSLFARIIRLLATAFHDGYTPQSQQSYGDHWRGSSAGMKQPKQDESDVPRAIRPSVIRRAATDTSSSIRQALYNLAANASSSASGQQLRALPNPATMSKHISASRQDGEPTRNISKRVFCSSWVVITAKCSVQ